MVTCEMNNSMVTRSNASLPYFGDAAALTPEYYVTHYIDFLRPYIGRGRPSEDTVHSYVAAIDQLINYCHEHNANPLKLKEFHLLQIRESMYQHGYKQATVNIKLAGIRAFYKVAYRLGLIDEDPAEQVRGDNHEAQDLSTRYLTENQLQSMLNSVGNNGDDFVYYRNVLFILLMGVEGLRSVEVHRMSKEDVDFDNKMILIHGKGHDDFIFPSQTTMDWLKKYLYLYPLDREVKRDQYGTPMFLSASNRNVSGRISRRGIRNIINSLYESMGIKQAGLSCHLLRHTCGTLLYKETKDLIVVKETLRHRDVKMTSRYAHLQERLLNRYTSAIAMQPKTE